MSILSKVTWKTMWKNKPRTIVTIIGIILSAAMFTAVTTMAASIWDFLVQREIYEYGDCYFQFDYVSDDEIAQLRSNGQITQLADYQALGFLKTQEGSNGSMSTFVLAAVDETFLDTMPAHLTEGRHPANSSEIVLPEIILEVLEYYGMNTQIGSTITMDLITDYDGYSSMVSLDSVDKPFTKSYTIVGYIRQSLYQDYELGLFSMLTYADGDQGEALWHRAFLKSDPQQVLELYKLNYGYGKSLNSTLLGYHGVTQFANYSQIITGLTAVLCAIIMLGSVSLIYNAFSISVSERTKQFGLLSSIGATKKQLRRAVFSEAATVSAIGIPLGLFSGYVGIALTLKLLSGRIDTMFSRGDGTIKLRALLSPAALVAAALIALITVLISAWIPAARAARITPMEAIRQSGDFRTPKKAVRVGKLAYRLFGLPGTLGKKYYTVSRKRYRATVISLVISLILFISAACFSQAMRSTVENVVRSENYDIHCRKDYPSHQKLRQQPFVSNSAYVAEAVFMAYTPDSQLSDALLECWDSLQSHHTDLNRNVHNIRICYLEDRVLEEYLKEQRIAPEPYFLEESPLALVCSKSITTYYMTDEHGDPVRFTYKFDPFTPDTQTLCLFEYGIPDELDPTAGNSEATCMTSYSTTGQGQPLVTITPFSFSNDSGAALPDESLTRTYLICPGTPKAGKTEVRFFLYDPETGTAAAEAAATKLQDIPVFRLGAAIDELPFGIQSNATDSYYYTTLILPLSHAPEALQEDPGLRITVSDYAAAVNYLNDNFEPMEYINPRANQEDNRTLLFMINVFSYGFIILISLISTANVFNTISTNVALRRRDFGMLRSTGFREKDLLKMMNFECLIYGSKALLWGLPISLAVSYLIWEIERGAASSTFVPPWSAMIVAAVIVLAVVFSTMFYAVSRLRKDNPIDAIRLENT